MFVEAVAVGVYLISDGNDWEGLAQALTLEIWPDDGYGYYLANGCMVLVLMEHSSL